MTLVSGWASDEGSGRLEMLLTTPMARSRWATSGGAGVMLAIAVLTVFHVPHRPKYGASIDATAFLEEMDLETFPQRSVIIAGWTESLPLLYEQYILGTRPDINIVIAQPGNWLRMADGFPGHPIFFVGKDSGLKDRVVMPFRNVWRLTE